MNIHNKRQMADDVLAYVTKSLAAVDVDLTLQSYQNGREQGHALVFYGGAIPSVHLITWIGFSECRNSDDVVVYVDKQDPMQSISDDSYAKRRLFDTPQKAGDYIIETILNLLMESRKETT